MRLKDRCLVWKKAYTIFLMFRSSKTIEVELKLIFLKRGTVQKRKLSKTGEGAKAVGLKGKALWEDRERLKNLKTRG